MREGKAGPSGHRVFPLVFFLDTWFWCTLLSISASDLREGILSWATFYQCTEDKNHGV